MRSENMANKEGSQMMIRDKKQKQTREIWNIEKENKIKCLHW